jgi:RNA polymerase sigma-70 factor (ECF subfamily)
MPKPAEASVRAVLLDDGAAERLRPELLSDLARRTGDPVLAEDLTQETLVRVLRGLPRFRGDAALRTWARRIALNVWRDYLRRRSANPIERPSTDDGFSVIELLDSLRPAAPAPRPEDTHDRRATRECLVEAARQLPASQRDMILLHELGATPLARVAAALGCSIGAAKVRLHRARRRVAEICSAKCEKHIGAEGTTLCSPRTHVGSDRDYV